MNKAWIFFTVLPAFTALFFVLIMVILTGVKWSQSGFNLYFPGGKGHWTLEKYLSICVSSFENCLPTLFAQPFISCFVVLVFNFFQFFIEFRYQHPVWGIARKDFLPFCRLFVHSEDNFFCCMDTIISHSPLFLFLGLFTVLLDLCSESSFLYLLFQVYSVCFSLTVLPYQGLLQCEL